MDARDSGVPPGGHALESAIEEFLESGNKAGNYRDALERVLGDWRERLERRGVRTVEAVTKRHMAEYAKALSGRVTSGDRNADGGISAATAWTYYDYVSAFLSYCVRWDWLEENPAQKGVALEELPPRPKKRSGDQQFWSPDDRNRLLRYADRRAHDAVEAKGSGALEELRDRALVYVLAYSGVRGGEILSDPRDDRRNGLRWGDVDLENSQLLVLGKNQHADEEVQLPRQAHSPIERLERALDPPSAEWPVFVTNHAPSLYATLPDDVDPSTGDPLTLHRERGTVPPSLSTNGGRSVLKRLCEDADIDVDGGYLKPHGARRGVGEAVYREHGAAAAQRVLRHADPRTTSEMYAHIEASELAEEVSEVFESE
ncbi:tyrosine-type recombinase/integrase [Natrarchaeobius chitinivorans]|uniref:Site-specific integrase n=1 Tax=Natrarchaeobius chitinivorans TaxID=1679083 RepID=A0A3N6P7U2_NATCH|nr:site-specific integrase [Natrarchaeobius chitinivorans]RQG94569.1 site-specific integrase [Natrarchaeobius chitinivorans]